MMDLSNPEAVIAEKRRREERKKAGLPLHETPEEIAARNAVRIAENDKRLEKEIQRDVRNKYIAFGAIVYWLSQPRETKQTSGLGDLYIIHRRCRVAFWHETKTETGEQSSAQRDFEEWNAEAGVKVVVGGVLAAEEQLIRIGAAYRDSSGSLEPSI